MPFVSEEDAEFARAHISTYYDTDFFPKHFAFGALWHCWDEVKALLLGSNASDMALERPSVVVWPKPKGGYRLVHQLDPLSSLAYAAYTHNIAVEIERAREPRAANVACSYRIDVHEGSFFGSGTGFEEFQARTKTLAGQYPVVLLADISDFYNQIYVHRVRNAVSTAGRGNEAKAQEFERVLMKWNLGNSQGLPVGPAASIVLSEAVLIDVDQFLRNRRVAHTRYVDDFRIFGTDNNQLRRVFRDLTSYLYEVHRLHLSGEKTKLLSSPEMLHALFSNPYEVEKIEIFDGVEEVVNPYTQELEEVPQEEGREEAIQALVALMDRVLRLPTLEIGLARAVIRRAKRLGIDNLVDQLFEGLPKLLPVINDVCLYLKAVCYPLIDGIPIPHLERAVSADYSEEPAFRLWVEWLVTSDPTYTRRSDVLRQFVMRSTNPPARARLSIIDRDVAWVREMKAAFGDLRFGDKLAVLFAAPVLAEDERQPWLRGICARNSHASPLEKWMARAALDGALEHDFASDDLPF